MSETVQADGGPATIPDRTYNERNSNSQDLHGGRLPKLSDTSIRESSASTPLPSIPHELDQLVEGFFVDKEKELTKDVAQAPSRTDIDQKSNESKEVEAWYNNLSEDQQSNLEQAIGSILNGAFSLAARRSYDALVQDRAEGKQRDQNPDTKSPPRTKPTQLSSGGTAATQRVDETAGSSRSKRNHIKQVKTPKDSNNNNPGQGDRRRQQQQQQLQPRRNDRDRDRDLMHYRPAGPPGGPGPPGGGGHLPPPNFAYPPHPPPPLYFSYPSHSQQHPSPPNPPHMLPPPPHHHHMPHPHHHPHLGPPPPPPYGGFDPYHAAGVAIPAGRRYDDRPRSYDETSRDGGGIPRASANSSWREQRSSSSTAAAVDDSNRHGHGQQQQQPHRRHRRSSSLSPSNTATSLSAGRGVRHRSDRDTRRTLQHYDDDNSITNNDSRDEDYRRRSSSYRDDDRNSRYSKTATATAAAATGSSHRRSSRSRSRSLSSPCEDRRSRRHRSTSREDKNHDRNKSRRQRDHEGRRSPGADNLLIKDTRSRRQSIESASKTNQLEKLVAERDIDRESASNRPTVGDSMDRREDDDSKADGGSTSGHRLRRSSRRVERHRSSRSGRSRSREGDHHGHHHHRKRKNRRRSSSSDEGEDIRDVDTKKNSRGTDDHHRGDSKGSGSLSPAHHSRYQSSDRHRSRKRRARSPSRSPPASPPTTAEGNRDKDQHHYNSTDDRPGVTERSKRINRESVTSISRRRHKKDKAHHHHHHRRDSASSSNNNITNDDNKNRKEKRFEGHPEEDSR